MTDRRGFSTTRTSTRTRTRMAIARLALAAGFALAAAPTSAHGVLEATTPVDGATVADAPDRLTVRFDTPHRVTLLRLTDAAGDETRLTPDQGRAASTEITAPAPELAPGDWTLDWRAIAPDGHLIRGAATFTYAPR